MKLSFFLVLIGLAFALGQAAEEATSETKAAKEPKEKKADSKKGKEDLETHVKRCPIGWQRYQSEKCFKYLADQLVTQDAAEAHCQTLGSTLASIESVHEREFLLSLVLKETADETLLGKIWIGLRRKAGQLFWFDLSPVSSLLPELYYQGHPAAAAGNCGALATDQATLANSAANFAKVHLGDCAQALSFVCQKVIIGEGSRFWHRSCTKQ